MTERVAAGSHESGRIEARIPLARSRSRSPGWPSMHRVFGSVSSSSATRTGGSRQCLVRPRPPRLGDRMHLRPTSKAERTDIDPVWTPVSTRSSVVVLLVGVVDDVGESA